MNCKRNERPRKGNSRRAQAARHDSGTSGSSMGISPSFASGLGAGDTSTSSITTAPDSRNFGSSKVNAATPGAKAATLEMFRRFEPSRRKLTIPRAFNHFAKHYGVSADFLLFSVAMGLMNEYPERIVVNIPVTGTVVFTRKEVA